MNDAKLDRLRDLIQEDVGRRGLRSDPERSLVNACPDDFRAACRSLAEPPQPQLAIVTGFYIPTAKPPAGETDGPLGALFLARALTPLGIRVAIATDDFCTRALEAGLAECGLGENVPLVALPTSAKANAMTDEAYAQHCVAGIGGAPTHLLAIERVGPSHTHDAVPPEHRDRCHTMRGRDITDMMSPAHRLFEMLVIASLPCKRGEETQPPPAYAGGSQAITTIGIGDGGNEIGMGKIPWDVIDRNISGGGLVACRIATQHLIVCGISNWGAYALAAGVALLRGKTLAAELFDPARERQILNRMVRDGPLVDGVTGQMTATVDGVTWEQYADVLVQIKSACV